MKMIVVVALALVAVAAAAPAADPAAVPAAVGKVVLILREAFSQNDKGGYDFGFESEDGINRDEHGELKAVTDEENKTHDVVVVRGSYSYPGEDGKPILFSYYADESGYHVEGDLVPKVPVAARR